eukprot:maker-scaffold_48-snap-gene-1.46-mRNA-1 protein AED:0.01 eAED:0.01 QI:176/0.66/0.75/1/1/1/4/111/601
MKLKLVRISYLFGFVCSAYAFNREELKQNLLGRLEEGNKVVRIDIEKSGYKSKRHFHQEMEKLGLGIDFIGEKNILPAFEQMVPRKLEEPIHLSVILVSSEEGLDVLEILTENKVLFEDSTNSWVQDKISSFEQDDFFCKGEECVERELQDFFSSYQELPAIHARFDAISEANINRTLIDSLGQSYEGRDLKMMWIGESEEEFTTDFEKPLVIYMCNIHAREWLTPLYCTYMAEKLLDGSDESNDLLSKFTFVIAPSMNPDGYVFSYTNDTFWRGTRKPNIGSECIGADGNRNWGPEELHCGEGSSTNPCSDDYCGEEPFDQPETAAISNFSKSIASRIFAFADVHSFGRYFMSPWGWTTDLPPSEDYGRMKQCFVEVRETIYELTGDMWTVGTGANAIYITAGSSDDWFYSELGVIYANTIELRGNGFQPDPGEIMPSNIEAFAGMVAHLNCAYNIEFVTESPGVGSTAFPTSYPTLSCRDSSNTGISLDGEKEATCEELQNACDQYWGGIPGEQPNSTRSPDNDTGDSFPNPIGGEYEEYELDQESEQILDVNESLMVFAVVLLLVLILLLLVIRRNRKKVHVEELSFVDVERKAKQSL